MGGKDGLFYSLVSPYLTPAGRQAAWNLAWMISGTAITQLSMLGVVLILTRELPREQFGSLAAALAVQGYLVLLGSAGMPVIAVREMVRRPQDRSTIAATFLAISWTLGGTTAIVAILALPWLRLTTSENIVWTIILLGAAVACGNPQFLFDAFHRQRVPSLLNAAVDFVFLGSVIALTWASMLSLVVVAYLMAGKWILTVLCMLLFLRQSVAITPRSIKWQEGRAILKSSMPILIASILYMIPTSGGILFVRAFHGPKEAAIIGLAFHAFQAFTAVVALANRVVRPHINGPWGMTPSFIRKLLVFYSAFVGLCYLLANIGLYFVVAKVLTSEYAETLWAGSILLAAGVVIAFASLINEYLVALHRERLITYSLATGTVFFIVASLLIAPVYGVVAQCIIMVLAFLVVLLFNTAVMALV